ncbi:MAG: threonine-phosphate decarboxylase CobD [Cyanobacteria bacterium P01_A01_bin.45]
MGPRAHGGNVGWAAAQANCPADAILDFSASISPLGPPQKCLEVIQSHLGLLRHYPDPEYQDLKQALSQFHQLPPEWIMPGNGSAELLTYAGRELSEQTATVLMTPAFGDYYRALTAYNVEVLEFPVFGEGRAGKMDLSTYQPLSSLPCSLLKFAHRRGLVLNNPHNPTGKLWTRLSILPLLQELPLVVVDEAFMDFLPPEKEQSLIPLIEEYPNLVILRSLTKFYSLPGLRLGYAISHPQRLKRWQSWRDPWSVNILASAAAIAALADKEFQQQSWEWLAPTRNNFLKKLSSLPGLLPIPSTANFLLVNSSKTGSQLQESLLKCHQILIRDCLSFSELDDRYFRVAVLSKDDNERLISALSSILSTGF